MTTFLNRFSNSDLQRVRIVTEEPTTDKTYHDGLVYGEEDRLFVSYESTVSGDNGKYEGISQGEDGELLVIDASAGLPADTFWESGLPISEEEGRLCVDPVNDVEYVHDGVPFTGVGAVAVDGDAPTPGCDNPTTILSQALDTTGTATAVASQLAPPDDSKAYQPFSFVDGAMITDLHWRGTKVLPPEPSVITAWLIEFWNNGAGIPGTLAQTMVFDPALANETSVGIGALGTEEFTYSVDFDPWFLADAGVTYWVSVQPALGSGTFWYWRNATSGSSSYIIINGEGISTGTPLTMDVTGCEGTEPTVDAYEQESNTDLYEREVGTDLYIQE